MFKHKFLLLFTLIIGIMSTNLFYPINTKAIEVVTTTHWTKHQIVWPTQTFTLLQKPSNGAKVAVTSHQIWWSTHQGKSRYLYYLNGRKQINGQWFYQLANFSAHRSGWLNVGINAQNIGQYVKAYQPTYVPNSDPLDGTFKLVDPTNFDQLYHAPYATASNAKTPIKTSVHTMEKAQFTMEGLVIRKLDHDLWVEVNSNVKAFNHQFVKATALYQISRKTNQNIG